jgi:hypothetical protein
MADPLPTDRPRPKSTHARLKQFSRIAVLITYFAYLSIPWLFLFGLFPNIRLLKATPTTPGSSNAAIDQGDIIQFSVDCFFAFSFMFMDRAIRLINCRKKGVLLDLRRPIKPVYIRDVSLGQNPTQTTVGLITSGSSVQLINKHSNDPETINNTAPASSIDINSVTTRIQGRVDSTIIESPTSLGSAAESNEDGEEKVLSIVLESI